MDNIIKQTIPFNHKGKEKQKVEYLIKKKVE